MHPTTIGLDLAKHVFQVHGVDAAGKVIIRKKLLRSELKAFFEKLPPLPGRYGGVRDRPLLGP
jgi:transposase